ncbi:MAG TPA: hypothetical protein VL359_02685, partial [bacterium]|nr:hypothetical protein [bacterium]
MNESATPAPGAGEPAKILLVDDEPRIVAALQRELRQETFALTACTDPAAAQRAFQQQEFALVISD